MPIKRQNPDTIELINESISDWLEMGLLLREHPNGSDLWFTTLRQRHETYQLLKTLTGLSEYKLGHLIANLTNTSSYWLPDGSIRKDHP